MATESPQISPLVSVIVPAYNHQDYVQQCLDSILHNNYPNKELCIIDDGSTDLTSQRIKSWVSLHGHEIVVKFRSRQNKGVSATLNELIEMTSGEFICPAGSDDYLLSDGLIAQERFLREHPEKLAVVGDYEVVDKLGVRILASGLSGLRGVDLSQYGTDKMLRRGFIVNFSLAGPVLLARREVFEVTKYDEGLRIEDWDFYLRLVAQDALGFVPRSVCAYRIHDANTCRTADVSKRVRNLVDQAKAARSRLDVFAGADKVLLKSQWILLKAKADFLEKRWFNCAVRMSLYYLFRFPVFWFWDIFKPEHGEVV